MPRRKKPQHLARASQAPPIPAVPVPRLENPGMMRAERTEVSFHQGPLPDPATLERYDLLVENGAERIFAIMEKQVDHRIAIEAFAIRHDSRRADWGLFSAAVITLAFLASAVWLVYLGHDVAGTTLGTVSLAALVGVFVYGTARRSRERAQKAQAVKDEKK